MQDVRGDDLQDEPLADFDRGRRRLAGVGDEPLVEHRNPGAGEDAFGLMLGDAALRQGRQVFGDGRHWQRRRGDALGAAHRAGDGGDGGPRILEQPDPRRLVAALHLRCGDRRQREIAIGIPRRRLADRLEQRLRHLRRAGPGREEPDHRRKILLAEQQLEALVEDRGVVQRLRGHIHRIARRRERHPRQHLLL